MPAWLIGVLVQFPIVVVIGFVAWYAYREVRRTLEQAVVQEREAKHRELALQDAAFRELIAEKDKRLERAEQDWLDEVRAVGKKVDSLVRKLN